MPATPLPPNFLYLCTLQEKEELTDLFWKLPE